MAYRMLAFDYDETLAVDGVIQPPAGEALAEAKAAGWRLALVTGRPHEDLLERFPLLFAAFLFDDLVVALLQPLAPAALLRDGLGLACGASRTPVPPPVQLELVMIELAVFEDAHAADL